MNNQKAIRSAVVKMHRLTLSLTFGLIGGILIFLPTAILLLKGGKPVGPHLSLLGQFLPGYMVSWTGSAIGFCWGAFLGALLGFIFGSIYNRVIDLRDK